MSGLSASSGNRRVIVSSCLIDGKEAVELSSYLRFICADALVRESEEPSITSDPRLGFPRGAFQLATNGRSPFMREMLASVDRWREVWASTGMLSAGAPHTRPCVHSVDVANADPRAR